jgi:hypothetical protein
VLAAPNGGSATKAAEGQAMADQAGSVSFARLAPRQLALPWVVLVALAAAWAITVTQARSMGNGPGTMGPAWLRFLALWVLMMAAMMLPSVDLPRHRTGIVGVHCGRLATGRVGYRGSLSQRRRLDTETRVP